MDPAKITEEYYGKIYKLALYYLKNGSEAEDLTQDIFFKVLKNLSSFKMESQVYTWIYRIAVNTLTNYLRRKKIVQFISFDKDDLNEKNLPPDEEKDPAARMELEEEKQNKLKKLDSALNTLTSREKGAFFFFHYEKIKQKDIAVIMGTSVSAVESLIFKSTKKIKRFLAGL
ncbi:MAG: sigma-70 family RNA polymerase sigma factor [Acidobacteriota bacterium]